jgi:CubicO group peptidase (beta-lactamase class C family)
MQRTITLVLLILAWPVAVFGQGIIDVSAAVAGIRDTYKIPAIEALVLKGDTVIAAGYSGVREADKTGEVSIDNRFYLAGCTKAMTATMCGVLVDQGRLKWDTTVVDVFPQLKDNPKIDPAWRIVTLRMLLSNRSGLPEDLIPPEILTSMARNTRITPEEAREQLMQERFGQKPSAAPGTQTIHSNSGFAIAAHMAETITRTPYEFLMQQLVFRPLSMPTAGFGPPTTQPVDTGVPQPFGHRASGESVHPETAAADDPIAWGPAGRVCCSLPDWTNFISVHLSGEVSQNRYLNTATYRNMHEIQDPATGQALGWVVKNPAWAGGPVLISQGSNSMWSALAWIAPQRNLAILIVSNQGGPQSEKPLNELATALADKYGKPGPSGP